MDQDKPKSTIEFKLTPKAKSPSLRLLRNCVLSEMPKDYGSTDLAKTQVLLFLPPVVIVAFLMMIVSLFIYVRLLLSLRESLKAV
jgi:hypothetical protein